MVTVLTLTSSESPVYSLTAIGILIFKAYQECYLIYQQNVTKNIKIVHVTVTTPGITGPSSYEISGTSVTLSCGTISDSSGTGAYVWKFEGQVQYVLLCLLA